MMPVCINPGGTVQTVPLYQAINLIESKPKERPLPAPSGRPAIRTPAERLARRRASDRRRYAENIKDPAFVEKTRKRNKEYYRILKSDPVAYRKKLDDDNARKRNPKQKNVRVCARCGNPKVKNNQQIKKNTSGIYFCCKRCWSEYGKERPNWTKICVVKSEGKQ